MTGRKRFFVNGLLLSVVGLTVRTVGLAFGAFVSRTIGAEGMGLYTLIMTVYSFAITFATSGISLTVTRLVAGVIGNGDGRGVSRVIRAALIYALLFSGVASAALSGFSVVLAKCVILDMRAAKAFRILSLSLVPCALGAVFSGYFVGVKRVGANALVQIAAQLAKVVLTVIFVTRVASYGTGASIIALVFGITLSEIIAFLLILLQFVIDRLKIRLRSRGADLKGVFGMAVPLALSAYIRSGLVTLEHVLIPKRLKDGGRDTADSLASYGALHGMALPVVLYPMTLLSSFSGMLVPEFAEGNGSRRHSKIASEVMNTTLSFAIAVAVFLWAFARELGEVIYDSRAAGAYIALIAPIIPIMYLDHVTDSMLKGAGQHVYSMWVNILDSLLSVVLVWLLIPRMGVGGYALVIIVMELFNFTLSLLRLYKCVPFSLSPVRAVFTPLASSALAVAATKALFVRGESVQAPFLVFEGIFGASLFVALTLFMRLIAPRRAEKGR